MNIDVVGLEDTIRRIIIEEKKKDEPVLDLSSIVVGRSCKDPDGRFFRTISVKDRDAGILWGVINIYNSGEISRISMISEKTGWRLNSRGQIKEEG